MPTAADLYRPRLPHSYPRIASETTSEGQKSQGGGGGGGGGGGVPPDPPTAARFARISSHRSANPAVQPDHFRSHGYGPGIHCVISLCTHTHTHTKIHDDGMQYQGWSSSMQQPRKVGALSCLSGNWSMMEFEGRKLIPSLCR